MLPRQCSMRSSARGAGLQKTGYFGGADLVRLFSAFMVMAFHLGWRSWAGPQTEGTAIVRGYLPFHPFPDFFWSGWVGVEVFFVISGLVIANSAMAATPLAFAKSRIMRLYPAVWICATITLAIWLIIGADTHLFVRYASSVLLLPFAHAKISPVYWTLATEMVFYLLVFGWRLLVPAMPIQRLAAALLVWNTLYLAVLASRWHGLPDTITQPLLMRHGACFALGIFLWLQTKRPLFYWESAALVASVCIALLEIRMAATARADHLLVPHYIWAVLPPLLWATATFAVFLSTTKRGRFDGLPPQWIRAIRIAGLITYPLYLVHAEFGALCMRIALLSGAGPWPSLGAAALAVLLVSWSTVIFVEPTLRRWLRGGLETLEMRYLCEQPRFRTLYGQSYGEGERSSVNSPPPGQ